MALRLLDLYSGAGGAARGYQLAGFEVTGIDIAPQPRYCGEHFIQADALAYLAEHGQEYDAIHASPPCQGYSVLRHLPWLRERDYPLLIAATRERLEAVGVLYVIENVMGAQSELRAGWLCGQMFGLPIFRHRLFATNWPWLAPGHPQHEGNIRRRRLLGARARDIVAIRDGGSLENGLPRLTNLPPEPGGRNPMRSRCSGGSASGYGHQAGIALVREAIQIDWMTRDELTQAIPPAYTRFLGNCLRNWIERREHGH